MAAFFQGSHHFGTSSREKNPDASRTQIGGGGRIVLPAEVKSVQVWHERLMGATRWCSNRSGRKGGALTKSTPMVLM